MAQPPISDSGLRVLTVGAYSVGPTVAHRLRIRALGYSLWGPTAKWPTVWGPAVAQTLISDSGFSALSGQIKRI